MEKTERNSGFVEVHHGSLYYEVAGTGKPILLIHAGVADNSMWDDQFALFSRDYRVIRYDTRGYGRSRTETTTFSNRQDILDLFHHLGVEKACIIGISRGGQIAIDFTLEHPEAVWALVAVAPGISGYEYQPDTDRARQEYALFDQMDELWNKKAFDELTELQVHVWADGPLQTVGRAPHKIRQYLQRNIRAGFDRKDGEATPQPLSPLAINRLAEIRVPTLVMVGDYDASDVMAVADKLEREVAGSKKVVFPNTAHMIPLEQPAQFNQDVLEFLAAIH